MTVRQLRYLRVSSGETPNCQINYYLIVIDAFHQTEPLLVQTRLQCVLRVGSLP